MTDSTTQDGGAAPVNQSPLQTLVGEGKKFKDVDALADGKLQSDKYITKIEGENRELRSTLATADERETALKRKLEFYERLNHNDGTGENGKEPPVSGSGKEKEPASTGLGADDVLKLVETRETKIREANNLRSVEAALVKEYGADAQTVLKAKAAELGVELDYLLNTAKTSPQALLNMIGYVPNDVRNASLTNGARSASHRAPNGKGNDANIRGASYYEKLKKEMGATKFILNQGLQMQMHKDMDSLGDAFDSN